MLVKTEAEKKATEWEKKEKAVLDEVGRCFINMQLGLFSAKRAEKLHAKVIQYIAKRVTDKDTHSIALSLRKDGLFLLINPDYFLNTLGNTEERLAALRHEENHLFLGHPFRAQKFALQIIQNRTNDETYQQDGTNIDWDATLFEILADFECNQFISGYTFPSDSISPSLFPNLNIPHAASVETTYQQLWPLWVELNTHIKSAPLFTEHPKKKALIDLYRLTHHKSHSDHQHWRGEKSVLLNGSQKPPQNINRYEYMLLENEMQRILVHAREGLSEQESKTLPKDIHGQLDGFLKKRNLKYTDPKLAKEAEKTVEKLLIQFQLYDPFFGQFLLGCARQITDTISTAGVALLKQYIVLLVNPTFFMTDLISDAERAGVLKHEALHIMLKHIIQMHNPKYPNKRLYNIAADLEVNQYIGAPWTLPESALRFDHPPFKQLNLPANDVAETYYILLQKEIDKGKKAGKQIEEMSSSGKPTGGHSDHGGWGEPEAQGEDSWSPENINGAKRFEIDAHEQDIERALTEAKDALGAKGAGKIPGHFLSLMDEWGKARKPAIDWKRELRLFVSSNPSTTIKRSSRKKSKRYFHYIRESLRTVPLPSEVIRLLSREKSPLIPVIEWGELSVESKQEMMFLHQEFKGLKDDHILILHKLPFSALYYLLRNHTTSWPEWSQIPDTILKRLDTIRIPLDPDFVPIDLILSLSKQHPHMLPPLSWDEHFGKAERKRIQKTHMHILEPLWALLPSEELITLNKRVPELFKLKWSELPPQFLSKFPFYNFSGSIPFRIDRIKKRTIPGLKKERNMPKILVIIDTSGSMSEVDIEYVFAEIDGMHKLGCEVHVLQADTAPSLYFHYTGEKPLAGRGGTSFDPAIEWLNNARTGVQVPVKQKGSNPTQEEVTLRVDGVIYLTDGYARAPTIKPYCRMIWVLTPLGTDSALKEYEYSGSILTLPSYENR